MKKVIATTLSLLLVLFTLAACSSTSDSSATTSGAASADTSAASGSGTAADGDFDTTTLLFATTYNEAETSGQAIQYFADYIAEKSGGAITFNIKWGGTVAGSGEEVGFMQSGAIDMSAINHNSYSDVFPLLNFPGQADGSQENCMDYFNHMVFENEETASLIQAQVESQGVMMIGFTATGNNAFASKQEVASLEDLKQYKLGTGMNMSAFEELGFNTQFVNPWDGYDSLSRGIVDTAYMATSAMVSLNWNEVAPYFLNANIFTAGNYYTLSLDKWNSFSADTQALFTEAMEATAAYSEELVAQQEAEVPDLLEAGGGKQTDMDEADSKELVKALFKSGVVDCRALAESSNSVDEMETVLAACSEFLALPLE